MFRNLQAEQARMGLTNQEVAERVGISRVSYESKKKTGRFTVRECVKLCKLFDTNFEYLFDSSTSANTHPTT